MGFFSKSKKEEHTSKSGVNWIKLESEEQLLKAIASSTEKPVLLFKHSTRCSISSMALNRFEKEWDNAWNCDCYYLDLIALRNISNRIAQELNVEHQSPQAIVVENNEVIYHASHSAISASTIKSKL